MTLNISEIFYSIQGEGVTTGVPSIFIRCQSCNLMCGGALGSLVKQGKATWWCDSETVWKGGKPFTNEDIENKFIEFGELQNVLNGTTHLIWTGGEPTIPRTVTGIIEFMKYINEKYPQNSIYNEIETNGTLVVPEEFYSEYIDQINCSAKLQNSGMAKSMRINSKAIEQIKNHKNYWLKIVVSSEDDIKEILTDYIEPFNIPKNRLILMPGVDNLTDLSERTRFACDMAKKYNTRMCSRLQVLAWDKTVGV
jgi:7-carboxy-7-deazaguanine synthase